MRGNETMSDITLSGTVQLYHYSRADRGEETILDPKECADYKSSYSRNDYKLSNFPRCFYYTDLTKVEQLVTSQASVRYDGEVQGTSILHIVNAIKLYKSDPTELKRINANAYITIQNSYNQYDILEWDMFFEECSKFFDGTYYDRSGTLPIVVLFVPLKVTRHDKR